MRRGGKNRQTREVSSLSSLLTKPRKFLLSRFAKPKSYNEQLNSGGWWLRFLWSVVIKGVWKDMNGEWAVTNAKKECEEVVTNTIGTSFRIGTPRFKKKKKKIESRAIYMLRANSHPRLTWVHFEACAWGDNVDAHFFTKLWQIKRAH